MSNKRSGTMCKEKCPQNWQHKNFAKSDESTVSLQGWGQKPDYDGLNS